MIEIDYYRKYNRVTVKGHAESGEVDGAGHDMVCTAASILAYTLGDRVQYLAGCGQVREPITRMDAGDTEIQCRASTHARAVTTLVFDTVTAGFELLAESYPDAVKFTIHEG